jgi:hypothetical protein
MSNLRYRKLFLIFFLIFNAPCVLAQVNVFENNKPDWLNAVGQQTVTTISFDNITVPPGTDPPVQSINGDEFSSNPGNPVISLVAGTGIFVGNPALRQIPNPPSGANMLIPDTVSIEGILKITFNEPVKAIGATFVDAEADFATTGFSLNIGAPVPDVAFSSDQGNASFSFLGLVSDTPFTEVEIHFASRTGFDGALLDDLVYSLTGGPPGSTIFRDGFETTAAFEAVPFF